MLIRPSYWQSKLRKSLQLKEYNFNKKKHKYKGEGTEMKKQKTKKVLNYFSFLENTYKHLLFGLFLAPNSNLELISYSKAIKPS